jgi:hypothetical protein
MDPDYGVFAAQPPEQSLDLWGGQRQDGLPYCEHVRYVRDDMLVLYIRTLLPEREPAPVIGTVEDFTTVLRDIRRYNDPERGVRGALVKRELPEAVRAVQREDAETPSRDVTILLDGSPIPGTRKDFADYAVGEYRIDGKRILCAGSAEQLDALSLRSPNPQQ